jgi:hypothetical protein
MSEESIQGGCRIETPSSNTKNTPVISEKLNAQFVVPRKSIDV